MIWKGNVTVQNNKLEFWIKKLPRKERSRKGLMQNEERLKKERWKKKTAEIAKGERRGVLQESSRVQIVERTWYSEN